jgi:putative transposase
VTVAARREGVQFLVAYGLAQRRACPRRQLPRSTGNYQARPDRHAGLVEEVHELAQRPPRYGYRRVGALRRRRGRRVHRKHGHRLWKRAKLQGRKGTRTRGPARAASLPVQARHAGHVWTDDLLPDHGLNGTPLKGLTVMDECTREGLAVEVATSLPAQRVLTVLEGVVVRHGRPPFIRRDNGPAFIALAVRGWLAQHHMRTLDSAPGCPWQNGFGDRFNGTGRDECLSMHVLHSGAEAPMVLAAYRRQYHAGRPPSRLGSRTPTEFRRDGIARQSPSGGLSHVHWSTLLGACQR